MQIKKFLFGVLPKISSLKNDSVTTVAVLRGGEKNVGGASPPHQTIGRLKSL